MFDPLPRDDRAGVQIELQGGVERLGWWGFGRRLLSVHGRDHPVHLRERQCRRRQHGRPIGDPDGFAQLRADRRPGRVAVPPVQVRTRQATGTILRGITLA